MPTMYVDIYYASDSCLFDAVTQQMWVFRVFESNAEVSPGQQTYHGIKGAIESHIFRRHINIWWKNRPRWDPSDYSLSIRITKTFEPMAMFEFLISINGLRQFKS